VSWGTCILDMLVNINDSQAVIGAWPSILYIYYTVCQVIVLMNSQTSSNAKLHILFKNAYGNFLFIDSMYVSLRHTWS